MAHFVLWHDRAIIPILHAPARLRTLYPNHPTDVQRLSLHLRALVPLGGALYPQISPPDLRGRGTWRSDRRRQAAQFGTGLGAHSEHGRARGAGARLSPAGGRAVARQGARCPLPQRHAHHRFGGAGLCPRGRRAAALRNRSRLQHGVAQHPHGWGHGARDFGQLHHRATGGHRRWHRLPALRAGAQGRHRGNRARARHGGPGAAVAVWLFAHGRGVQPQHGRGGHECGRGVAGRQADLRDRGAWHPRAAVRPTRR